MENQVLVITGMHRSGTSLVTHWLHACGLQVGERLLQGGNGNVEGHFEDLDFLELHQEILGSHGADCAGLRHSATLAPAAPDLARMRAMIAARNTSHAQWGWKEPRTCLLLDTYSELLPEAHYLVLYRDYEAVVGSLVMRDFSYTEDRYLARNWLRRQIWTRLQRPRRLRRHCKKNGADYLRAWINYNNSILKSLAALPRQQQLVLSGGMLQSRSSEVHHFLSAHWGFKLRYKKFSDIFKNNLISKKVDWMAHLRNDALLEEASHVGERFQAYLQKSAELLDTSYRNVERGPTRQRLASMA